MNVYADEFEELILKEINRPNYVPRRTKELARHLGISKAHYAEFRDKVRALKRHGRIVRGKGGRWTRPRDEEFVVGNIQLTRSGRAFLLPEDPAMDDIAIGADFLGSALHGDRVKVHLDITPGRGFRHFGRVVEVIERARPRIVAVVTEEGTALPEDPRNPFEFRIDGEEELTPETKILLEITNWPGDGGEPAGKVLEVLGPAGEPDTEIAAILASFDAPGPFPGAVKAEVANLYRRDAMADRTDRLDLTDLIAVTIDPKGARDYDDALSLEILPNGRLRVGVHIADVSRFVKPGSRLDEEARARSTSIYLPSRVIPMLPEELSNDLCSLRPQEERFAKTVFLDFDAEGKRHDVTIRRSVIRSRRRMTYAEVKALLSDSEAAAEFDDPDLLQRLERLNELAQTLRARRVMNGAIELNMPEFRVMIDAEGFASDITEVEHDFSHQLVEEFMLSANTALAEWSVENGLPILHRVHEPPEDDSIEELSEFLFACGHPFRRPFTRERLNAILRKIRDRPEEHAINLAILKSFKKAVYDPRGDIGHFALNFSRYTHFTSPIRRYPDLYLHQMLQAVWPEGKERLPKKLRQAPPPAGAALDRLGKHTSSLERRAMKIEDQVTDFRRLELLSRQERRIFDAVVTGIRKFGIFVEIEEFFVEGFIPRWMVEAKGFATREIPPNLNGKRSRHTPRGFHLGQEVCVRITSIDLPARVCEMELLGLGGAERQPETI